MKSKTLFEEINLGFFDFELKEIYSVGNEVVARHIKNGFFRTSVKEKRMPMKGVGNSEIKLLSNGLQ